MEADGENTSVLIVGGGPVGLTLASELSFRGVDCIMLEKKPDTSDSAKAVLLNCRTMEYYRRLGLEDEVRAAGFPVDQPLTGALTTAALGGHRLYTIKYDSAADVLAGQQGRRYLMYTTPGASSTCTALCPQYRLEPVLKNHLLKAPNVGLRFNSEATYLSQDNEGVTLKAEIKSDDGKIATRTFRAKYLVGTDGGSSWVRKQLGIHTYGKFVVARACSITFQAPKLFARLSQDGRAGFTIILNPKVRGILIALNTEGGFALHVILPPDYTDEQVNSVVANADQCICDAMGEVLPYTLTRAQGYNMHCLVATKYQEGRCFLAGDAAHQWLPAGGLGLNTGIGDAVDLAWKLEAILKGFGGPHLFDSYQLERRTLADLTRRFALDVGGELMLSYQHVLSFLVNTPLVRNFFGQLAGHFMFEAFSMENDIILGFCYSSSNIIIHEPQETGGHFKLHATSGDKFSPVTIPGTRAPHVMSLPGNDSILDLFGKTFVLLIIGGEETDCQLLRSELATQQVPLQLHSFPKLPELVALYDHKYYLVRPDGVIAWRSNYQPSNMEASRIVRIITGHDPGKRLSQNVVSAKEEEEEEEQSTCLRCHPFGPVARGFLAAFFLRGLAKLSETACIGAGMTITWLWSALHARRPKEFRQTVSRHRAVVIESFGEADRVIRLDGRHTTELLPTDVLIKVRAVSINRIDVRLLQGYGAPLLRALSRRQSLFPLVPGRDCSGEVVAVGDKVTKFVPGDQVYAAQTLWRQGTCAEYAAINESLCALKPRNLDHKEAATLPYVAASVWTGLVTNAGLSEKKIKGKRVLVHAGTGGVGSFAVQLLKAWGAEVTTTCSTQNVSLAHSLGADKVFDYTSGSFSAALSKDYDLVFDTLGAEQESLSLLKVYGGATYVSLISPRMSLATTYGNFLGSLLYSCVYGYKVFVNRVFYGRGFHYIFAQPNGAVLEEVAKMVETGAIRPVVSAVYDWNEIVEAFLHVAEGHARGKVVVTF